MNRPWVLVVAGCGTVGFWTTLALLRVRDIAASLIRMILIDPARIRPVNAITCPGYAGREDRYKSEWLAHLAGGYLPSRRPVSIHALSLRIEQAPWRDLLVTPAAGARILVVAGLDNWQARLVLAEDLRAAAPHVASPITMLQVGLDTGRANVHVYGTRAADPCPACGLAGGCLPEPESCVSVSGGHLRRGNLHREAKAAARLVCTVVSGLLRTEPETARRWLNTGNSLVATGDSFRLASHRCERIDSCLGPHSNGRPVRWDAILDTYRREAPHEN